jgi:hypothetical protein
MVSIINPCSKLEVYNSSKNNSKIMIVSKCGGVYQLCQLCYPGILHSVTAVAQEQQRQLEGVSNNIDIYHKLC